MCIDANKGTFHDEDDDEIQLEMKNVLVVNWSTLCCSFIKRINRSPLKTVISAK